MRSLPTSEVTFCIIDLHACYICVHVREDLSSLSLSSHLLSHLQLLQVDAEAGNCDKEEQCMAALSGLD